MFNKYFNIAKNHCKTFLNFLYNERQYSIPAIIVLIAVSVVVAVPSVGTNGVNGTASVYYAFDIVGDEVIAIDEERINVVNGDASTWSELQGDTSVLVIVWSSWCRTCRSSLEQLQEMSVIYENDIQFIGVNPNEAGSVVKKIIDDVGITFPNIIHGENIIKLLGVDSVPTYIFLDTQRKIKKVLTHTPSIEDVYEFLN